MPGASNNGGEDGPGGVITGEAGLAHAGAIVDDKSGNVLVTHLGRSLKFGVRRSREMSRKDRSELMSCRDTRPLLCAHSGCVNGRGAGGHRGRDMGGGDGFLEGSRKVLHDHLRAYVERALAS